MAFSNMQYLKLNLLTQTVQWIYSSGRDAHPPEKMNFGKVMRTNPLFRTKIQHTSHNDYISNTKSI